MAVPTWVGAGTGHDSTGAITYGVYASRAQWDIEILFIETSVQSIAVPSGWAHVLGSPVDVDTFGTDGVRLNAIWRRLTSSNMANHPNPSIPDVGDHQVGQVHTFRGVRRTGDPWDVNPTVTTEAIIDTSGSANGPTTGTPNCLVVVTAAVHKPDAAGSANFSAWTNAALASITERMDMTTADGKGGGLGMATGSKATAGAVGATTYTVGTAAKKAMLVIPLVPTSYALAVAPADEVEQAGILFFGGRMFPGLVDEVETAGTLFFSGNAVLLDRYSQRASAYRAALPYKVTLAEDAMARVAVSIPENDEPLLQFDADGDLTGASVKWVSKTNEDATDASGVTINGTVTDATNGIFTIQLLNTVTGPAVGHKFYKVVVTKGGHPVTVQFGPLNIDNV